MSEAEKYCEGNLDQAYNFEEGEVTPIEDCYLITPNELDNFHREQLEKITEVIENLYHKIQAAAKEGANYAIETEDAEAIETLLLELNKLKQDV